MNRPSTQQPEREEPEESRRSSHHGAPLELVSARDVETLVRARGAMFLVTNRDGNVLPRGARELGLFHRDTRFLSYYELRIGGVEVAYLSAETAGDAVNQIDLMLGGGDSGDFLDDPSHYVHIRRRQLLDDAFIEELTFTNYLTRSLCFDVLIAFDADFADIFEIRGAPRPRRGRMQVPRVTPSAVEMGYEGMDGATCATRISFSPDPTRTAPNEALFELALAPGQVLSLEIVVRASYGSSRGLAPAAFADRRHRLVDEATAFRDECARIRCDHGTLAQSLARSESDLFALLMTVGDHTVLAAGIPWFCAPFGRDALLASYEALLLNPALAIHSLRMLAAYQGRDDDPYTEEEPGKIFHELRFGEMTRTGETPHTPYYGSVDATPLFVIVAHATYEVTGDLALMAELRPAILAALGWIDRRTQGATTFATYQRRSPRGLDNQGWKDSRDGVVFPNGRRAVAPIALCEVQGYCVDAYARGARLLRALGDEDLARGYESRARAMTELLEDRYWIEELGRYAFAIDGAGARLPTVVSNLGHLLWSRVADPVRARAIAELLVHPSSFSGFGVRTLAAGQEAYNPLSYHNGTVWPHDNALLVRGMSFYGLQRHAVKILEGFVAALDVFRDRRLPELFCGMDRESGGLVRYPVACSPQAWAAAAPYLMLQSALGVNPDAPARRLLVRDPYLPPSVREIVFERLRIGDARVTLRFQREAGRCHVDVLDIVGGPVQTVIELS
jgi:glycogen debranching enzyme